MAFKNDGLSACPRQYSIKLIGKLLYIANFKEENILYPTIDEMITPEGRAEVLAKIEAFSNWP